MNADKKDRIAGMLLGSLVADALALGAHWVYDQNELAGKFGRVSDFRKPLPDSYHPKKAAGEQTHYGDQTLVLLASLQAGRGAFLPEDFALRWRQSWIGYQDYFDHATTETLAGLERGLPPKEAASASEELGGPARIAPLLAAAEGDSLEEKIAVAQSQTALTHNSPIARDSAEFLTRVVHLVLSGAEISAAINEAAALEYEALPASAMQHKARNTRDLDMQTAGRELGLACPAAQAWPTIFALLERYPNDMETALIENVMTGGDSAARGLVLGMILGARLGESAIPPRWLDKLSSAPKIRAFLGTIA